jgi:multidrug efflux pump subunit AcrB
MQKCNQPSQFEKFLMLLLLASFVYAMLLAAKYERITTSLIIWVVFILVTIAMITLTMCGTQGLQKIRNLMPQFLSRYSPVDAQYPTVAQTKDPETTIAEMNKNNS